MGASGGTWSPRRSTTVAETLRQFRGRYRYNLIDEHVRRFNAEVPMIAQWDDHEVLNNWYPGRAARRRRARDARYREKDVNTLARPRQPGVQGLRADPARSARSSRVSSDHSSLGPAGGGLRRSTAAAIASANSPNRQPQPGPGHGDARRSAARLAGARARAVRRCLEDCRVRHADRRQS